MLTPVRQRVIESGVSDTELLTSYKLACELIHEGYPGLIIDTRSFIEFSKHMESIHESVTYTDHVMIFVHASKFTEDIWHKTYRGTKRTVESIKDTGWSFPILFFTDDEAILKFKLTHGLSLNAMDE